MQNSTKKDRVRAIILTLAVFIALGGVVIAYIAYIFADW